MRRGVHSVVPVTSQDPFNLKRWASAYALALFTMTFFRCLFFVFFYQFAHAQANTALHGYVQDAQTGEKLIGATVKLINKPIGMSTNRYGFFSLSVITGDSVIVSYVGYQSERIRVQTDSAEPIAIMLKPDIRELGAVTIRQSTGKDTYDDATMGRFIVPLDMVKKGPALLGENDILKTIQLLPGVQSGSEGTVGLNVRGGSPDQNLVLLDGIPLYNLNHLFGFFSIINTDAVAQADFLKGSIPARYGGRLSSVLDITMREGNLQQWKGNFGISPIAGRLTVEGPIKKDVGSVLISARRTWLDALYWLGNRVSGSNNSSGYGFYDVNAKVNYKLGNRDRLYLSFYTGSDAFSTKNQLSGADYSNTFDWGNRTLGLRWNHLYSKRLFGNLSASFTNFRYNLSEEYKSENRFYVNRVRSGIRDLSLRADFDFFPSPSHTVKFGGSYANHIFSPEIKQFRASTADTTYAPTPPILTDELTAYAEDDWILSQRLRANVGVHYANQFVNGRAWHSVQPRLSVRYLLGQQAALKVSYNQMTQFLHLLTNSSVGLPTDLWVPVTDRIPPEQADWLSAGYSQTLGRNWNFSVETYYKRLRNVLDYKEGTAFLNNFSTAWYDRISLGKGTSYGVEFYAEKTVGRTKGWLSYTISRSDRQFEDINGGKPFPFKFDRRHSLAIVASHEIKKNKTLSANFVYNTGTALTVTGNRYAGIVTGSDILSPSTTSPYPWQSYQFYYNLPDLGERNNFRTPAYHRLDVSYRTTKQKTHGQRSWIISCYNVYNRLNPFYLYYDKNQLKQFTLFPIIPSVTYQYDF